MTNEQLETRWAAILKSLDKISGLDDGDRLRLPLGFPFNFVGNRIGVAYVPVVVQHDQLIPEPMEIDPMDISTEWMLQYAVGHSRKPQCSRDVLEFLVVEHQDDDSPALGLDVDSFDVYLVCGDPVPRIDRATLEKYQAMLNERIDVNRMLVPFPVE